MSTLTPEGVTVIKPGQTYVGKQGFTYDAGASAETVGARKVCMNILPMPHAPRNESSKPCTWIVVHSSGSDQDGIVLLPELDTKLAQNTAAMAR